MFTSILFDAVSQVTDVKENSELIQQSLSIVEVFAQIVYE